MSRQLAGTTDLYSVYVLKRAVVFFRYRVA